jgi:hypothetical protein
VWLGALTLVTLTAHGESPSQQPRGWWQVGKKPGVTARAQAAQTTAAITRSQPGQLSSQPIRDFLEGQRLFDRETFEGNGRTCLTCHSRDTGTVSPRDAQDRFQKNPNDPLFVHDGSDDEDGDGFGDGLTVTRMLKDATLLMRIPLHPDVELKGAAGLASGSSHLGGSRRIPTATRSDRRACGLVPLGTVPFDREMTAVAAVSRR